MNKQKTANRQILDIGVTTFKRRFPDLIAEYEKEDIPDYLGQIDHSAAVDDVQYDELIDLEEKELNSSVRKLAGAKKALVVVFQGRDASGKSGATERILQALDYDPKLFLWIPIGEPNEVELDHPYLWRFTIESRMPPYGQMRVFDRSWNERVLVERVEKLTPNKLLQGAYAEIRAFEWLLVRSGIIMVKFWMDITKEEQDKRFKARRKKKPWKYHDSDIQARKHWDDYTEAANEMFHRTGTDFAPWHVVSSEDKKYSRIAVLQIINDAIRSATGDSK
jgi:AMP-polyphosphate phosphotransferase